MQIMIVFVYWISVYPWWMEMIKDGDTRDTSVVVHEFMVHTLPLLSVFFCVTFSNITFAYSNVTNTVFMCLIFFVINYYGVINYNKGQPLYPFFPWIQDF